MLPKLVLKLCGITDVDVERLLTEPRNADSDLHSSIISLCRGRNRTRLE
jgi:hypothetical protein